MLSYRTLVFSLSLISLFSTSFVIPVNHPHLYFSEKDLPLLKQQAKNEKRVQFDRLQQWGENHLGEEPPKHIGAEEKHHESAFSVVTNYGVLYQITRDARYLEAGMRWLEVLLSDSVDIQGYFVVGTYAASLAHGYDLFFDGLPPDFRERLKEKLIQALEETRKLALTSWWGGIYTHHDFWIPIAFMGVAAICLKDEYPPAGSIVRYASDELSAAMELLGEEGYWPEGVADWVYGMAPSLMFFDALRRSGGKDFYQYKWMRHSARARLQHWLPGGDFMPIGDSFPSGRYGVLGSVAGHLLMRLASEYKDPHAQWLALKEAEIDASAPPLHSLENPYSYGTAVPVLDRERHGLAWQFLWYDPSVEAVSPDSLEKDRLYPNWDTAIFRAGWGEEDPVLVFAGGHLLGRKGTKAWEAGNEELAGGLAHTHQNAGAFYLWADGGFPIWPPAFGARDGRFHSTVMVNGHGQFFDPAYKGKLTAFESGNGWAMASMDLTGSYPPDVTLGQFVRTLVYLKPRTVLIFDRLRGSGDNYVRRYEWLLQTNPAAARWRYHQDTFRAVPLGSSDTSSLLIGRVFPSYRYYFERHSLDRPDGKALNRALSVTIIGRMPDQIDIAAVLHAPAPSEDTGWIHRAQTMNREDAFTFIVPDGPYFVIPTGPKGSPTRTVIFAKSDSVMVPEEVPDTGMLLVVGLSPQKNYRVETTGTEGACLVLDPEGEYHSSKAGNLLVRNRE